MDCYRLPQNIRPELGAVNLLSGGSDLGIEHRTAIDPVRHHGLGTADGAIPDSRTRLWLASGWGSRGRDESSHRLAIEAIPPYAPTQ